MEKIYREQTHEQMTGGSELTIGVIGLGNMGSATVKGLIGSKIVDSSHLFVCNRNTEETINKLHSAEIDTHAVTVCEGNIEVYSKAEIIILALKQAQLEEELKNLKGRNILKENCLIVSIAAGIETTTMKRWLGDTHQSFARLMPNTPVQSGRGVIGWFIEGESRVKKENQLRRVVSALGKDFQVEREDQLHAITAISGSGPAYLYRFTEAMVTYAMELRMSEELAKELVYETFIGSAIHADKEKEDIGILREQITSKGGTTEQAIRVFDDIGIDMMVRHAMSAAHKRSIEIAKEYDRQ